MWHVKVWNEEGEMTYEASALTKRECLLLADALNRDMQALFVWHTQDLTQQQDASNKLD